MRQEEVGTLNFLKQIKIFLGHLKNFSQPQYFNPTLKPYLEYKMVISKILLLLNNFWVFLQILGGDEKFGNDTTEYLISKPERWDAPI